MTQRPKLPRTSASILSSSDSPFRALTHQAEYLTRLQTLVDRHLPPSAKGHLLVASYGDDRLLLIADGAPSVATLRYRQRELINSLRREEEFRTLGRIQFSVRPSYTPVRKPRETRSLSASAARQLASAAKYIEDTRLRKALIRLSRRGAPPD